MTDQTPIPVAGSDTAGEGPRLYGVIDVIRPERVAGWVIDRANVSACAEVDLVREGKIVATQSADRPRKDLERNGVGTGQYGFSIPLDPPLEPGMEFTLAIVARSSDGVECALQPTARLSRTPPEQKLLERVFSEFCALRATVLEDRGRFEALLTSQREAIAQLETVQIRIEAALAEVQPTQAGSQHALWGLVLTGIGLAGLSLGVGFWSIFTS